MARGGSGVKICGKGSLLYDIHLNRLHLYAIFSKKFNNFLYLLRLALELKGHNSYLIRNRGLPDVSEDLELLHTLTEERLLDLLRRISKIDLFFQGLPPTGYGRDDGEFVVIGNSGLEVILEADVLVIEIEVYKAAEIAVVLAYPVFEPGVVLLKVVYDLGHSSPVGRDLIVVLCYLPQRCWYPYLYAHSTLLSRFITGYSETSMSILKKPSSLVTLTILCPSSLTLFGTLAMGSPASRITSSISPGSRASSLSFVFILFLMIRTPPRSTLFT